MARVDALRKIWDQGGTQRPSPAEEGQFSYGAEFDQKHLNAALKAAPTLGLPATDIEASPQRVEGSHGTHVASIAAGNRGICRNARIAAVLVSLPSEDEDRRLSFYDSSRLADAVDYLLELAGDTPIVINISLGTNGAAHDGSAAVHAGSTRTLPHLGGPSWSRPAMPVRNAAKPTTTSAG